MTGKVNGLTALFLKENPKALYTDCATSKLNLAICSSCSIVSVRNLVSTVKDLKFLQIRANRLFEKIYFIQRGG